MVGRHGTGDGIPDECQSDCNSNNTPDEFDLADETSQDCNGNDIPDECDEPDPNTIGACCTNPLTEDCFVDTESVCNGTGCSYRGARTLLAAST